MVRSQDRPPKVDPNAMGACVWEGDGPALLDSLKWPWSRTCQWRRSGDMGTIKIVRIQDKFEGQLIDTYCCIHLFSVIPGIPGSSDSQDCLMPTASRAHKVVFSAATPDKSSESVPKKVLLTRRSFKMPSSSEAFEHKVIRASCHQHRRSSQST